MKHGSSSETGIEISLKSMDFKILVVHRWGGVGGAPLLLQRVRGGSSGAGTAQRDREDGQTDTAGLREGAPAPERGWGTRAGAIWHVNKGSPVWEDWAFRLVEGGQGGFVEGPLPRGSGLEPPAEQHPTPTPPETSALGRLLGRGPLLAGPDSRGWNEVQRPQSSRVRCRQAWKTEGAQGWGHGSGNHR